MILWEYWKHVRDEADLAFLDGNHSLAERLYRSALQIQDKQLGEKSAFVRLKTIKRLALACRDQGKMQEAIELFRRFLSEHEQIYDMQKPIIACLAARDYALLADMLIKSGDSESAALATERSKQLDALASSETPSTN